MTEPDNSQFESGISDIRERAREAQREIAGVTGTADAANGAVAVTVDSRGRLDALRLTSQALRLSPDELSAEILACTCRAAERSDAAVRAVSARFADNPHIRHAADAMKQFSEAPQRERQPLDDETYFEAFNDDPLGRRSR